MEFNLSLFKKFMELTTSSVDAEALQALRKANAMLKAFDYNWSKILDVQFRKPAPPPPAGPVINPNDVDALRNIAGEFGESLANSFAEIFKQGIPKSMRPKKGRKT